MLQFIPLIGKVIEKAGDIVDELVEDKDLKLRIKERLAGYDWRAYIAELQAASSTIIAEATGHSWLQRNWRPLVMLGFAYMIFHNSVIAPILKTLIPAFPMVVIPPQAWTAIGLGLGGYGVGRSVEKVVAMFTERRAREHGRGGKGNFEVTRGYEEEVS